MHKTCSFHSIFPCSVSYDSTNETSNEDDYGKKAIVQMNGAFTAIIISNINNFNGNSN